MEHVIQSVAQNVLFIFAFIGFGIAVGIYIRRFPKINFIGKMLSVCIFLLLFFLGKSVGKDEAIMNSLGTIGFKALIITIGAIAGSVLVAWFTYNRFFKKEMEIDDEQSNESIDK